MSEKRKVSVDAYPTYPANDVGTFLGDDIFGLYRHDTMRYPRLDKEEIASLAEQVQAGISAQNKLDSSKSLSVAKRQALTELVQSGIVARNDIVKANTGLVFEPARKRSGRGVDRLDLIQEGNLGLIRAAEKFDPTKAAFSTYAMTRIRAETAQAVHDMGRTIRVPAHHGVAMETMSVIERESESTGVNMTIEELAEAMNRPVVEIKELTMMAWDTVSFNHEYGDGEGRMTEAGEKINDPTAPSVEDLVIGSDDQDFIDDVRGMLENSELLTTVEKEIVWLRFGIGESSKMVAEEVSRSAGSVGRLAKMALLKLRVELEEEGTADYFNKLRRSPQ